MDWGSGMDIQIINGSEKNTILEKKHQIVKCNDKETVIGRKFELLTILKISLENFILLYLEK